MSDAERRAVPRPYVHMPRTESVESTTPDPYAYLKPQLFVLPQEQQSFVKQLLKDRRISRSESGCEVVPGLNEMLQDEYVSVDGSDFVIRKLKTIVRYGVVDRSRVRRTA